MKEGNQENIAKRTKEEKKSAGGEEHNGACMRTPVFTLCRISRMRTGGIPCTVP